MKQRKIHHLLDSEGEGKTFCYMPTLKAPFNLSLPLLVTEKVDGSTMQVLQGVPYKRFDLFKGRAHGIPEDDRYELRQLLPEDPASKWFLKSFTAFQKQFEEFGKVHPEHWLYFEGLGSKVNARYPNLEPTIRVFDSSFNGKFLSFEETVKLVEPFGFPVVGFEYKVFGTLDNLLLELVTGVSKDGGLGSHELEGWVLRQVVSGSEVVAKIRKADLRKLKA